MNIYPLSLPQQAFFLDAIKRGPTTKFNMGVIGVIQDSVDTDLFRKSLEFAREGHEILRMRVRFDGKNAVQEFLHPAQSPCPFTVLDLSGHDHPFEAAVDWVLSDFAVPVPLENVELHADYLLRLGVDHYIWYQKYHHIVSDGFGLSLLDETVGIAYSALIAGKPLPEIEQLFYADFIVDDQAYVASARYLADEAFWNSKFSSLPEPLPFTMRKKGLSGTHLLESEIVTFEVHRSLYEVMSSRCRDIGVSPAQFLMAVLFAWLQRRTGCREIVIGMPVLNRSNHRFRRTPGLFMGMMPLRLTIDDELSILELAASVRSETLSCYRHQRYPIGEIIRNCRSKDRFIDGVYDVSFIYREFDFGVRFGDVVCRTASLDPGAYEDSIAVTVDDFDSLKSLRIIVNYNPLVLAQEDAKQIADTFNYLIGEVAAGRNPLLRDLDEMSPKRPSFALSDTGFGVATIPGMIWHRSAETPDALAVRCRQKSLTYAELTGMAERVASYLSGFCNIVAGQPVALCCDRGIGVIVAMLGIFRAGCTYLPIDSDVPEERIGFILQDCGCRIMLVDDLSRSGFNGVKKIHLDELLRYEGKASFPVISADSLAYIIYTSGTTGKPKGVMIEHGGFFNTIRELSEGWNITAVDRMLGFSSPMFDASMIDCFVPLISGASVIIAPKEDILDPARFLDLLRYERVTVALLTPTYLSMLGKADLSPLRIIGTAGEAANPSDVAFHARYRTFVNAYGPTEITIVSNFFMIEAGTEFTGDRVPIGAEIGGMTVHILDDQFRPVPEGQIGELFIGGIGVGRGYLGRPELTAERFIPDPFLNGGRLYRSGDLGRRLSDGAIEYHGRRDSQVKVRGYRIELGEIESVLKLHPDVETVVVTKRSQDDTLVAYVVSRGGFDMAGFRNFLALRLPSYMIPHTWIRLDAIPMNTAGKTDYAALPDTVSVFHPSSSFRNDEPDRQDLVAILLDLWAEIFNGVRPEADDDFFMLGGHSLKAIEMMSLLQDRLGFRPEMSDFFENSTASGFARAIERRIGGRELLTSAPASRTVSVGRADSFVNWQTGAMLSSEWLRSVLLEIWANLLDGVQPGLDDDFFMLGGHSLKAIEMMSRLYERLGIRLDMSVFFENPTVSGLVAAIVSRNGNSDPGVAVQQADYGLPFDGSDLLNNTIFAQRHDLLSFVRGVFGQDSPSLASVEYRALSSLQERMWLVQKLAPESLAYIIPQYLSIRGKLDVRVLRESIAFLWMRHDALRTVFPVIGGRPRRVVLSGKEPDVQFFDFSGTDDPDAWRSHFLHIRFKPFSIEEGPLFRATIYVLGAEEHVLLFDVHHINADGVTIDILRSELFSVYEALLAGGCPDLPPPDDGYDVFVEYEASLRESDAYRKRFETRIGQLAAVPTLIDFTFDRHPAGASSHQGGVLFEPVDISLHRKICSMSAQFGQSPFSVYLAAFGALLHLWSGQDDILVGIPVSLRSSGRFARTAGFFVNTCLARLDFSGNPSVCELIERSGHAVRDMLSSYDVSLEDLVQKLCNKRIPSRPALLQAALSYFVSPHQEPPAVLGLEVKPFYLLRESAMFELTMDIMLKPDGGINALEYVRELWEEATVRRMHRHFFTILAAMVSSPDVRLGEIGLLRGAQLDEVQPFLAGEQLKGPSGTLVDRLAMLACEAPDKKALVCKGLATTRGKLATLIARRRGRIRDSGLRCGHALVLACRPGLEWTISALAAMAEGVTVIPVDTAVPPERLRQIIDNASARLLWHDGVFALSEGWDHPHCHCLDCREAWLGEPVTEPAVPEPSETAYIIYTSGSSGVPKGVRVSHRAFEAHCRSAIAAYELTPDDVCLVFAPFHVDAAWEQLFAALYAGATALIRDDRIWAPDEWCRQVVMHGVSCVDISSQYLLELLFFWKTLPGRVPNCLRLVICGGEAMAEPVAREWLAGPLGSVPLLNAYGPTEGVVTATYHRIDGSSRTETAIGVVPVGKPMPGRLLRVLGEDGRETGAGIPGELCIGGTCLADGYTGEENRMSTVFRYWMRTAEGSGWVDADEPGAMRLYRTGDRVRIGADGLIEFLGRLDRQIQIRGFRVEPGEIEAVLVRHPAICRALVLAAGETLTGSGLVSYCIRVEAAEEPSAQGLRDWLSGWLPVHMVPDAFVFLAAFPMTANDKIDLSALPGPGPVPVQPTGMASIPPADELEQRIAAVWSEVLGRKEVGLFDNFFDIGGHSVLLLRVHTRIQADMGIGIPLLSLFANPTVSSLAKQLRGESREVAGRKHSRGKGEIAVIGMAGRFPGADNVDMLWKNLIDGRESIRFYSRDELIIAGVSPSLCDRSGYVPAHGCLDGVSLFDAGFFGYTPREAGFIDPQQRLFLEECWHALEHAGYDPARYDGDIGVFGGLGMNQYLLSNLASMMREGQWSDSYAISLSNDKDFITTRVSYKLDLRGPSVNVNTACSTSLVAIHMAAMSLLAGECDMALAGGVTVQIQEGGYLYQPDGIMSPDGHCRAFSDDAAGTVGGSGGAVVVLKRLEDALADGDTIHAVIRGSAINNDGSDKVGFTAPGLRRQRDVIVAALERAGVGAADIGYVEAHGTGTPIGDPIEVQALTDAFSPSGSKPGSCYIGSIKSNIGHLDTAAGVAGFIKAVFVVRDGLIPPSLHCEYPSRKIDFENTPFRVPQQVVAWTASAPRFAGVSSFGMGGTNAHFVLAEPPENVSRHSPRNDVWCIPLSARSDASLRELVSRMADHLEEYPEIDAADIWFTLAEGRRLHGLRIVFMATSGTGVIELMRSFEEADVLRTDREGRTLSGSGMKAGYSDEPVSSLTGAVKFAKAWLEGDRDAARHFIPAGVNRRVPLTGYVFDHKPCWVESRPVEKVDRRGADDTPEKLPFESWFHFPGWELVPLRIAVSGSAGPILLIHDGGVDAERFEKALQNAAIPFRVCTGGDGFVQRLEAVVRDGVSPFSCWYLGAFYDEPSGAASAFAFLLERLCDDIATIARLLEKGDMNLLFIIPQPGCRPAAPADPLLSCLDAISAVIPHEYRWIRPRVLRFDPEGFDERSALLVASVSGLPAGDRLLTLSGGRLWKRVWPCIEPEPRSAGMSRCIEHGVYLITGGTGGVGMTLARYLAKNFHARLVLLSRRDPDEGARGAILAMQADGAEVVTVAADVADTDALRAVIDDTVMRWGGIDGVIHAAGVGAGTLIAGTRLTEIKRVIHAKVSGTLALAEVLSGREPGFVLLCSSLTASLGGPGQVAYTAANAWLDAWAESRYEQGETFWKSLQWDAWGSVGMAARLASLQQDVPERQILLHSRSMAPGNYWPWGEHLVNDVPVLPGTAYLELFMQSLDSNFPVAIAHVTLTEPLVWNGELSREVQVFRQGEYLVLRSGDTHGSIEHARAELASAGESPTESLEAILSGCREPVVQPPARNGAPSAGDYVVKAHSRWKIDGVFSKGDDGFVATFDLPALFESDLGEHPLHPALLDTAISYAIAFEEDGVRLLPWKYAKVVLLSPLTGRIVSHARIRSRSARTLVLDVNIYDTSGRLLVRVEGYTLVRPATGAVTVASAKRTPSHAGSPFAITPDEGVEVFLRSLASPEPVLCLSTVEWRHAERLKNMEPDNAEQLSRQDESHERKARPEQQTPFRPPGTYGERLLAAVWGEVLGYKDLGIDDDLFELGADSLSALGARVRVEESAGCSFSMERFFSGPTIASLACDIDNLAGQEGRFAEVSTIEHWEEGEL